ncbi:MAG: hypothetical protein FGF48_02525 [Candidatus Brockarchaeota archaeon]|nr:hypothetical protein [Candidatus Brockarchaeota archaeon]
MTLASISVKFFGSTSTIAPDAFTASAILLAAAAAATALLPPSLSHHQTASNS